MNENGLVVWEGRQEGGYAPLFIALTGLQRPTTNTKTGPMVQSWLLRSDLAPDRAVAMGLDGPVCNNCPLRPALARKARENDLFAPACYVTSNYAPLGVFRTYKKGGYPVVPDEAYWPLFLTGKRVRLGSYGNFSNAGYGPVRNLALAGEAHTGYEHNWEDCDQRLADFLMASVSSLGGKEKANRMGWRTFRVKAPDDPVLPDEIVCPASDEAGKKTNCFKCLLCNGNGPNRKTRKNIVINDHGHTSELVAEKRRMALEVVS